MRIMECGEEAMSDSVTAGRAERARRAPEALRAEAPPSSITDLIGDSHAISEVVETCLQVAHASATVLLLGETGTGKELLARAIHEHSARPGPFVAINCGAVNEALVESELFGYEKGAFTGANVAKIGLFREANRGTLLLDEIGSLPAHAQHSLLRVLQEGRVRPVGATHEVKVDVRVIAATSVSLDEAMETGAFRPDLFYRLDVIRVVVPPLRNRGEDIVTLFNSFSARMARRHRVEPPQATPAFEEALLRYSWPGNVRQLENMTERLVLTCPGERLTGSYFKRLVRPRSPGSGRHLHRTTSASATEQVRDPPARLAPDLSMTLRDYLERVEGEYLEAALKRTRGHVHKAARLAGLSRRTLSRKIKKFDLHRESRLEQGEVEPAAVHWLCAPPLKPYRLDPGAEELALGRAQGCDFVFPLPGISRVHARLHRVAGGWVIEDAGSRNGTRVNGARLTGPTRLGEGDVLEVDSLRFRVVVSVKEPEPHSATSTHLVRGQVDVVSLPGVLDRIGALRGSARIDVAGPEGSGHLKLVDGELLWASFEGRGERQCVGDEAVGRLRGLQSGRFAVSGSPMLSEKDLFPLPPHFDLISPNRETRSMSREGLLRETEAGGDETDVREVDPYH